MTDKPKRDPRWPAVIIWGLLSALALPVWIVGVAASVLRAPLRYSSERLNAELHRTAQVEESGIPASPEPPAGGE